jgi:hypothetical protein
MAIEALETAKDSLLTRIEYSSCGTNAYRATFEPKHFGSQENSLINIVGQDPSPTALRSPLLKAAKQANCA